MVPTTDKHPLNRPALLVIAIMLLAFLLRIRDLGALGFWIDEQLTWMAAKGILAEGVPNLPSGMIYARGTLYTYLVSIVTWIGGDGEFALRIPSVVFSLALIPLIYRFGRDLGGEAVGLVSALILAVSPWDIHYARMARMYAMFIFLFTLSIYLFYLGFMKGQPRMRKWAVIVAILAVLTHRQGVMLAPIFFLPALFPRPSRPSLRHTFGNALLVGGTFIVSDTLINLARKAGPKMIGTLQECAGKPSFFAGKIDLNHARVILFDIFHANGPVGIAAALVIVAVSVWLFSRLMRDTRSVTALLAAVVSCMALVANELVVACLAALFVLKLGGWTGREAVKRALMLMAAGAAVTIVIIGASALAMGPSAITERMYLRLFFAIPVPWYRLLILQFPFMSVVVLVAGIVFLYRSLPSESKQDRFFLGGCLVLPMFVMGLVPAPFYLNRYNFYLNPVFTLLFVLGLVGMAATIGRAVASNRDPAQGRLSSIIVAVIVVLGLVLCRQADPAQAWALGNRSYGDDPALRDADLSSHFYYDLKTTAEYVREASHDGDIVITRDPVGFYPYLGLTDFVLRGPYYGRGKRKDGTFVDSYLDVPHLHDAAGFESVLREHADKRVWVIMSESRPEGPDINVPEDVLTSLERLRDNRVYMGLDRLTYILRIDRARPHGTPGEIDNSSSDAGETYRGERD